MWISRCIVVLLAMAVATSAAADPRTDAQRLFKEGQELFGKGQVTDAIVAFERGYRALPRPEFLLNLAQCHRALGHPAEAIDHLRRFIAAAPEHPLRPAAERTLEELERSTPRPAPAQPLPPPLPPALAPAQPAPAPPTLPPPAPATAAPRRTWLWVTLGAVAVGGGIAAALLATRPDDRRTLGTLTLPAP
jgi:tetratricopeptide (TPR) repeat protein